MLFSLGNGYEVLKEFLMELWQNHHDPTHAAYGIGRDDSAKAPLKIPSILHSYCHMRITFIRFFSNLICIISYNW